jgi:hypothetical protein
MERRAENAVLAGRIVRLTKKKCAKKCEDGWSDLLKYRFSYWLVPKTGL